MLTGEEQKLVCKLAMRSTSRGLNVDLEKARCYVRDMTIVDSEIAPGMYDVNGFAMFNFDWSLPANTTDIESVKRIGKAASATASDFVIAGALPQSEEPSSMPSMQPSISSAPTEPPSLSSMPSSSPSAYPSVAPSISTEPSFFPSVSVEPSTNPSDQPSLQPSISMEPSINPSVRPSITQIPSELPSISIVPSISTEPTPSPTARHVFDTGEFLSRDIGYVGYAGQSIESSPGLYTVQGSGNNIWVSFCQTLRIHRPTLTFTSHRLDPRLP